MPGATERRLLREYVVHLSNAGRRIRVSFDGSAATTLVQVDVAANAQCQGKSLVSEGERDVMIFLLLAVLLGVAVGMTIVRRKAR